MKILEVDSAGRKYAEFDCRSELLKFNATFSQILS